MDMQARITVLYNAKPAKYTREDRILFNEFMEALNHGQIRSATKMGEIWQVNEWVKMGILIGFRMGILTEMMLSKTKSYYDKDTFPEKKFTLSDQVRIVPGGTSLRNGCYLAPGVAVMPPAFVNVGAYVDIGTLIDSHALVGSCAQIGKNVHLSAGAMIGGVLEPIGNRPVIIEDNAFVGGNTGLYEGVIVKSRAVIASGTIITASTPVFDSVMGSFIEKEIGMPVTIPSNAVVVQGSRPLKGNSGFSVNCPIIIKYRDEKTDLSVILEQDIRTVID
ncbi:MAG: 2,3,4,5-tetrahydropyridine-2,6-dicarboxylate N-succinyltransferase [Candidatus Cloacimonadaceae bacterium]